MTGVPIQRMADRVAELMEQRLRIRGAGLAEKLRRGGRLLPRKVRAAAQVLAEAAEMAQNPKLLMQVDQEATAEAYDICLRHLGGVDRKARRNGAVLNVAASVAFSILVVAVLVIGILIWRGLI
jgi:hypothetical protein